ncbi:unnamed protein product [Pylaiella littoralis]
MVELGGTDGEGNGFRERSQHTFVIEIDRQGARGGEQERLKWKWEKRQTSNTSTPSTESTTSVDGDDDTTVARELLHSLEAHLLLRAGNGKRLTTATAEILAGASGEDQQRRRAYSVEIYDPAIEGWIPLSKSTRSETIPKNCRVHVNVNVNLDFSTNPKTTSPQNQADEASSLRPERARDETLADAAAASSGGESKAATTTTTTIDDGGVILALPWRRFDQDLGRDGAGEGLELCGMRLAIGGVSNSSEGTGLFTWDGAVLLAKYLEHQGVAILRDFDDRCPLRRQTHPLRPEHERFENDGVVTSETDDNSSTNNNDDDDADDGSGSGSGKDNRSIANSETPPRLRVLELGCGTGLAGLAAAFSFGSRHDGHDGDGEEGGAALSPHPRHTRPWKGRDDRVTNCASGGKTQGVEVVLTDLEYALANARANISRNASSLAAVGSAVKAVELDWCRPLPEELAGEIVWDVRLTACWCPPCNGGDRDGSSTREPQQTPPPTTTTTTAPLGTVLAPSEKAAAAQEQQSLLGAAAAAVHPGAVVLENDGVATTAGRLQGSATTASPSREHEKSGTQPTRPKQQRAAAGRRRRVLLAHQWRSQRTGKSLLEELGKAFLVREITPEECHPDFLPSRNLCLFEAVRLCDGT